MIPKKIHYCWFGGNEIPEKDKKCIESWKKYCPDYESFMDISTGLRRDGRFGNGRMDGS